MRKLNQYILESILDDEENIQNKSTKLKPTNKEELEDTIVQMILDQDYDLNRIDITNVTDLSYLIKHVAEKLGPRRKKLIEKIDISEWDTSKVTSLKSFAIGVESFIADISKWDVSNVTDMTAAFSACKNFMCDLSEWDVSDKCGIKWMFVNSGIQKQDRPDWYNNRM